MKRVKFLLALLPAIILLAYPVGVQADSKTLNSVKDTYANQAYPDNVYGGHNHIVISNKYTTRLGYIWFENVDLPEGANVVQAILKFYVYEVHYSDRAKLNIGLVTGDWEEADTTWNHKPTINQTSAIEAEIPLTAVGWREVNITPLVKKWVNEGVENKGLFIYPLGYLYGTAETEYAFTFRTRESSDSKPVLDVEYNLAPTPTPTPTSTPTPTPTPKITPTEEIGEEEPTPTPEEEPTPTPEEERGGLILGVLSPFQALGGGLILLGLIGLGIGLGLMSRRKKKPKSPKTPEKKEKESSKS